jgi:hypothetical protein
MGLLDDLKTEVVKKQQQESEHNTELTTQDEFYQQQLQSVMLRARDYLSEVVENLNAVAPEIYREYPLDPSLPDGIKLRQADYVFREDDSLNPRQLDLTCTCTLEKGHQFIAPTKEAVSRCAEMLESYKFPHHCRNKLDERHAVASATFILEGPMKVHIRLLAHPEDRCIYIFLQNIEDLPLKRYKFLPEKVDAELLDRLARVLVRKESKLVEVKLSDDVRDELRRKLELEKRGQEEELARAHAYREAEKLAEEEAKLANRARRGLARAAGEVLQVFSKKK